MTDVKCRQILAIAAREIREALHGFAVPLIFLSIPLIFLSLTVFRMFYPVDNDLPWFSLLIWGCVYFCCMMVYALSIWLRFSLARLNSDTDFIRCADVSPAAVIAGKILAALLVTSAMQLIALPFILYDWQAGRIELQSYGFFLLLSTVCSLLPVMQALMIGAGGTLWGALIQLPLCFFFDLSVVCWMGETDLAFADGSLFGVIALLLCQVVYWGILTAEGLADRHTYEVKALRGLYFAGALLGYVVFNVTKLSWSAKMLCAYFSWWTGFAVLLMMFAAFEPTQPGRRTLRILSTVKSPLRYWLARLFAGSSVSGFLLGLLLLGPGCAGLWLSSAAGDAAPVANMVVFFVALAVFLSGALIWLRRKMESMVNLRHYGYNGMVWFALLILWPMFFLPYGYDVAGIKIFSLWGFINGFWGGYFLKQNGSLIVSIVFALAGIGLALPSIIVYFRLKKE